MSSLFGSICLSDIPREQMKKVMCKDGKERIFPFLTSKAERDLNCSACNGLERSYNMIYNLL